MSTISQIRDHVNKIPIESLFTTRDLLGFGPRKRVDDSVYDLIKSGEIKRAARGVFYRRERTTPVSVFEIASVKAKSFGREVIEHASDVAKKLGLIEKPSSETEHWFSIGGRSSSFKFGSITIHFKGTSLRKMALGDANCGQIIRALCFVGKEQVSAQIIETATNRLNPSQKEELGRSCASMPYWLSDLFFGRCCKPIATTGPAISSVIISSPVQSEPDASLDLDRSDGTIVSEMRTNIFPFLHREAKAQYRIRADVAFH